MGWFTTGVISVGVFGACIAAVSPLMRDVENATSADYVTDADAVRIARSGIGDALAVMRRRSAPIEGGAPQGNPKDGLVKELEFTPGVHGRYEVVGVPIDDGMRLRSIGYVYKLADANAPFNRSPNAVLRRQIVSADVVRFCLRLPGQAALCARQGGKTVVGSLGEVRGGADAVGIFYRAGGAAPVTHRGRVTGTARAVPAPAKSYQDSVQAVFGVSLDTLLACADLNVTSARDFRAPQDSGALHVVTTPELLCTRKTPLRGKGTVYVHGNLTIDAGSGSSFQGLLYVDGNLTLLGPARIRGAVIVTGEVLIQGAGEPATVLYDDAVLTSVRRALGILRTSRNY